MFGLPMEIIGPVIGIGSIIMFASLGVVMVRRLSPRAPQPPLESPEVHERLAELDQVKQRLSELEERVDFTERFLTKQREKPRLGPAQD